MKLTIITITYNAEAVLEATLKSVFSQTNQNFEYWIIDGASTDKTLEIAQKYKVKNIVSEPDKGIYDAMNKGLAIASSEYIWFLNAGDQIADNEVVERLFFAFKSNASIYYSDTELINNNGQNLGLRSQLTPHQLPKKLDWHQFKFGMLVCHQSFIVKRDIAPKYILNHYYSADIDWEIKCLKASKTTEYLDFILSKYLMGGFSVKNLRASLKDRFLILKTHFGLIPTLFAHLQIILRGLLFSLKNKGKYW